MSSGLPTALSGIDIVLQSNSGVQHTFRLTNNTVVSVGQGDLHDSWGDPYKVRRVPA